MVQIDISKTWVKLTCPYHPELPKLARAEDGDFKGGVWRFDLRSYDAVKSIAKEVFGYTTDGDYCDVLVTLDPNENLYAHKGAIFVAGRQIARATGCDSGAKVGEGVAVKKGKFDSCGSVKNWGTRSTEGAVFEIRDLPVLAFENASNMYGWNDEAIIGFEIVERDSVTAKALALKEKELLLERIKFLNMIIGN
jgi:hypothetical protein